VKQQKLDFFKQSNLKCEEKNVLDEKVSFFVIDWKVK
jgi:hypothetical protein